MGQENRQGRRLRNRRLRRKGGGEPGRGSALGVGKDNARKAQRVGGGCKRGGALFCRGRIFRQEPDHDVGIEAAQGIAGRSKVGFDGRRKRLHHRGGQGTGSALPQQAGVDDGKIRHERRRGEIPFLEARETRGLPAVPRRRGAIEEGPEAGRRGPAARCLLQVFRPSGNGDIQGLGRIRRRSASQGDNRIAAPVPVDAPQLTEGHEVGIGGDAFVQDDRNSRIPEGRGKLLRGPVLLRSAEDQRLPGFAAGELDRNILQRPPARLDLHGRLEGEEVRHIHGIILSQAAAVLRPSRRPVRIPGRRPGRYGTFPRGCGPRTSPDNA